MKHNLGLVSTERSISAPSKFAPKIAKTQKWVTKLRGRQNLAYQINGVGSLLQKSTARESCPVSEPKASVPGFERKNGQGNLRTLFEHPMRAVDSMSMSEQIPQKVDSSTFTPFTGMHALCRVLCILIRPSSHSRCARSSFGWVASLKSAGLLVLYLRLPDN